MKSSSPVSRSRFSSHRWIVSLLVVGGLGIGFLCLPSPTNMEGNRAYYSPLPPVLTTSLFRVHAFLRGWHGQQVDSPYNFRFYSNKNMVVPPGGCASSDVMDVQIDPAGAWGSLIYVQAYPITVCE